MTIQEAITWVDEKKHNVFSREDKLFWLARLEDTVKAFVDCFEGGEDFRPADCSPEASGDQQLMIPAPRDQIYLRWLECQMDYANQEYARYNNSRAMFEAEWEEFSRSFHRTHRYRGKQNKYL